MGGEAASLFVVSLPRSCSSLVHRSSRRAIGLEEPAWTTDGEVLNVDRFAHYAGPRFDEGLKYTCKERDPEAFERIAAFLDDVVQPVGVAYKDVVQPFVVTSWLARSQLRVLKVRRSVGEVAASMLDQGWYYPQAAAAAAGDRCAAVVEGLVRADLAIDRLEGQNLYFDDLIADEGHLRACLARLFPGAGVSPVSYIDEVFRKERRRQLARRDSAAIRRLDRQAVEVRGRLGDLAWPAPAPAAAREEAARRRFLLERVRRFTCELLPPDAVVVTTAQEPYGLLDLEGRRAWSVPATVGDLASARRRGAGYVVLAVGEAAPIPAPAAVLEWLEDHRVVHADGTCRIYDLS